MKKLLWLAMAVAAVSACASQSVNERTYNKGINIIPEPVFMEEVEGLFYLNSGSAIVVNDEVSAGVAEFYANKLRASTGYPVKVVDKAERNGNIELCILEQTDLPAEGYQLIISPEGVRINAKDRSGLFYGMASFMQLLPAEIESTSRVREVEWTVPCVHVEDWPRFGYRGIMQDPCRHFISVEDVKKHLDIMAMYKLNVMHFHLTEDQGWRIEIKKYPELTEKGSVRVEGDGSIHNGYYTQEELKELVRYAEERCITIIPEIEFPGHGLAAITAFPELACNGQETSPRIIWGVEDIVMCAGKESTFEFAENVLKEVAEIFPSKYIHIGGDECPKAEWKKCPLCQKRIDEEDLRYGSDRFSPEERLQSYFIRRIEGIVENLGRRIIGWDEILEGGLPESATVMSWRGLWGGIAAATQGHDVIMTPSSDGMYLNFYQGDPKVEPIGIGGDFPLNTVYAYNPVPDTLLRSGKAHHVLGVQGNCWAEYMYDESLRENFIYPKVLAVAEVAWTPVENKDFEDFCRRLDNSYVRLDMHGINYHIPVPEQPYGSCNTIAFTDTAFVEFTTTRPVKMLYTLRSNGRPNIEYDGPIVMTESGVIRICSVLPSGKTSEIRTVKVNKEAYAPAVEIATDGLRNGLKVKIADGTYFSRKELYAQDRKWKESTIPSLRKISSIVPSNNDMRDFPQYVAVASGYVMIPEDGVYYFSSNNNDVSIDGRMIIDNDGQMKKFSHNDCAVALAKGLHRIDVTFLGHIMGGWPSNWDSGNVLIRRQDETKFKAVSPEMLWCE